MSNRRTLEEKIEAVREEVAQKEARIKELLKQQKAQERKERNHRLCRRGGLVEGLLPELAAITDEQFDTFVEKCLTTPHSRKVLAELASLVPAGETEKTVDVPHGDGDDPAQAATAPAPKPANPAQGGGANVHAKPAQAVKAAS